MPDLSEPRWLWECHFHYNDRTGSLALSTRHATNSSMEREVAVGMGRDDIGEIEVLWVGHYPPTPEDVAYRNRAMTLPAS